MRGGRRKHGRFPDHSERHPGGDTWQGGAPGPLAEGRLLLLQSPRPRSWEGARSEVQVNRGPWAWQGQVRATQDSGRVFGGPEWTANEEGSPVGQRPFLQGNTKAQSLNVTLPPPITFTPWAWVPGGRWNFRIIPGTSVSQGSSLWGRAQRAPVSTRLSSARGLSLSPE